MTKKFKDFSIRLIEAMIKNNLATSRSPSGVCIKTLAQFAGASEQICRRYIRGEALPDYDKIIKIAHHLKAPPGWLLFGDTAQQENDLNDELLHHIIALSFPLYQRNSDANDYADFVLKLLSEVRDISASKDNLLKIIELAVSSISYKENQKKQAV